MNIELTDMEFRRLLDLVYAGNWILNSTRGEKRIEDFDKLESKLFSYCLKAGMYTLFEVNDGEVLPSREYAEGGIHEAIMDYEDTVFYEILAEELARRDMNFVPISPENVSELATRIDEYIEEFEKNGIDNISIDK
ncbi:MAG: hypothetical protein GX111_08345 [Clostridiales bacterium]|nr:hypothetical protein [Clostridiales bacterium]